MNRREELVALFPGADTTFPYALVPGVEVPAPYHDLLVHEHHMTVTVEQYHDSPVDVRVLEWRQDGSYYARKILLALRSTGQVVQFGIVRIDLDQTSPEVRAALLARQTPVGRILIQHDVLRRIEPTGFVRIDAGPAQMAWFDEVGTGTLYGRLAIIHCDGRPAVELLEVVRR